MNLDALKPAPIMDTVRFESEPPGAEAKTSTGQTCRTPCALALPVNSPLTVTFTLNGYQPESESIEPISATGSPTQLRPNPVLVELTPAPPSEAGQEAGAKAAKKTEPAKKPAAAKPSGRDARACRDDGSAGAAASARALAGHAAAAALSATFLHSIDAGRASCAAALARYGMRWLDAMANIGHYSYM